MIETIYMVATYKNVLACMQRNIYTSISQKNKICTHKKEIGNNSTKKNFLFVPYMLFLLWYTDTTMTLCQF